MRRDLSKYYFRLLEKFNGSGLTVKEFCHQHSLNNKTYYYWKKKYESQAGKHDFLPVVIPASPAGGDKTAALKASTLAIHYADGTRLVMEGTADAALIKALLPAFSQ
jgi:transposase-like protein